jgi:hypothetical protein
MFTCIHENTVHDTCQNSEQQAKYIQTALWYEEQFEKFVVNNRHYINAARVWMLAGDPMAALRNIQRAVENGYTNLDALLQDSILNILKDTVEWKAIAAQSRQTYTSG